MRILSFTEFANTASPDILQGITESVYHKDKYGEIYFDPTKDNKYKTLMKTPINKLTKDDMLYLYAVQLTKRDGGYWYDWSRYKDFDEYVNHFRDERVDWKLDDAYEFFSKLKFPLKVYRALRDNEDIDLICGKNNSICWTVDPNLYVADNSGFRHCTRDDSSWYHNTNIVEAEITADMVQNEQTIMTFTGYSAKNRDYLGSRYPENEITLKPNFKHSQLINLKYVDKKSLLSKYK